MSSTTTNKKQIVDFLWEWAEANGLWGKILISKIVSTENELTQEDKETIFNYFLQSINLKTDLPPITITKPNYTPIDKKIELLTLSNITGVNRLAKNQSIDFSPNLTVIFGENGTGKTGYGRILKSLGFSYDPNTNILSDISKTPQEKSAEIKFKVNETEKTFSWNGNNKAEELESISVFNNNYVQISLSDRQLIVTPIGFHLFNLVTSELNKLEEFLSLKINSYPTSLNWFNLLNNDTLQQTYVSSLSATSTIERLIELSTFTDADEQKLNEAEKELSVLNKDLIENEIRNLHSSILELSKIIQTIEQTKESFNIAEWNLLINLNKQILDLEKNTKKGLKEIAETKGIQFYQTLEFEAFIKSAEEYIKIIGETEYPTEDDNCIYCLQPLETSAKELLQNYRALLNDKSQSQLDDLRKEKQSLISKIDKVETNLIFNQSTYGLDDEKKPIQPKEIIDYNNILNEYRLSLISDKIEEGKTFDFDYSKYISIFTDKKTDSNSLLTVKMDLVANLSTQETSIKNRISELKDRKFLSTKVDEIKAIINNHKIISKLKANYSNFNTGAISRKTTEARTELVQQNFNNLFKEELKSFKKTNLSIDLNFGTSKGASKISHKINSHSLLEILSEGEQKAIALSEFLTELQLDNKKAPVIFDDPVNSLDHNIIDDTARRLIKLSSERQVVVFTHSILLFNSFLYFSKHPTYSSLSYKFYNTKNNYGETGIISEAEELNQIKSYISKINLIISNTPKDRSEADIAEDGYGYLRSAIELFVELEIFHGTVKRYQKNIAFTMFMRVDGEKINKNKDRLNEIFERCCGFIKGHSNPTEIYNDPTINELNNDFKEFTTIRNEFLKQ